jgi:glycosyltransferase involved in cell wall biosynthesis
MSKKHRKPKKDRRLRILWNSNAPWSKSGYGNQTRDITLGLLHDGWPIACVAFYGLEGGVVEWNGLKVYPKLGMPWGEDACVAHGQDFNADVTIMFQDTWVMNPSAFQQIRRPIFYVPIDHDPVQKAVLERLQHAYRIITYSKFGQKQLWKAGFNSTYIPHGVDLSIFKPMNTLEMRERYGLPKDAYIIGMVSDNKDNPPRKQFQRIMDGFKLFKQKHENAAMYFHAILNQAGGFPIQEYAKVIGIEQSIFFTPPYFLASQAKHHHVAELMNTFDALICASSGEGFGMPITEIQACGRPAIVNRFTSMPELILEGQTGYSIDPGYLRYSPLGSFISDPDPRAICDSMERTYELDPNQVREVATKHIFENYDIVKIVNDMWIPYLKELQGEIYAANIGISVS